MTGASSPKPPRERRLLDAGADSGMLTAAAVTETRGLPPTTETELTRSTIAVH